jgi:hypothetical protein
VRSLSLYVFSFAWFQERTDLGAKTKAANFLAAFLRDELMFLVYRLCAVEQHSVCIFRAFAYLTVEEAFAFEVNLDECRTRSERSLDQCF